MYKMPYGRRNTNPPLLLNVPYVWKIFGGKLEDILEELEWTIEGKIIPKTVYLLILYVCF